MKKLFKSKKVLVAAALATIMAISGGAYAWFSYTDTVEGGSIAMDKLKIEASNLVLYNKDVSGLTDVYTPVAEKYPGEAFDNLKVLPSNDSTFIGYTVTVPVGYPDVYMQLPGLSKFTSIDFRTDLDAMKGNGNMNPVWLGGGEWDHAAVRPESFERVTDPALAEWFGVSTISSELVFSSLPTDGSLIYEYSPQDGRLWASSAVYGAGLTFDVIFKLNISEEIDNRYQGATFNFDEVDIKATQNDDKAVAAIFGDDLATGRDAANAMIDSGDYAYNGGNYPVFLLYPSGDGTTWDDAFAPGSTVTDENIFGIEALNKYIAAN